MKDFKTFLQDMQNDKIQEFAMNGNGHNCLTCGKHWGCQCDCKTEDVSKSAVMPGYNFTYEEIQNLLFVLQFAFDVIDNSGLGGSINKENWQLDSSLEEQIDNINSKL